MVIVAYAGPVRPAAALRDSVLCIPTDIHSLFVNKPSALNKPSSSSSSFSSGRRRLRSEGMPYSSYSVSGNSSPLFRLPDSPLALPWVVSLLFSADVPTVTPRSTTRHFDSDLLEADNAQDSDVRERFDV